MIREGARKYISDRALIPLFRSVWIVLAESLGDRARKADFENETILFPLF